MHQLPRFKTFLAISGLLSLLAATGVQAHDYKLGSILIEHPWARATVPGQQAGGAFLKLQNDGNSPDRLVSASTEVAKSAQIHSMAMEGNVMRMREVGALDIPAGKTIELKPGGLHIMFMGLKEPLKAGDSVPLRLRFEKAGEVTVQVKVEALGSQGAAPATQMPAGEKAHQHQ